MIINLVKVLIAVMIMVGPFWYAASLVLPEYFAHGTCTFITTYPCTLDESLFFVFAIWFGSGLMFISIVVLVFYGMLLLAIHWIRSIRRPRTTPSTYTPLEKAE